MDIFSALQTSVSGLKAQSYAMGNIAGNIANSQTTGYKRIDTSFVDLMSEQTRTHEVAGSVIAQSRLTSAIAGNVVGTTVPTNMAINGDGFFVIRQRTGDAAGQASFNAQNVYTRRGDFTLDREGYLVNGAGGYLTGQNIDPSTGQTGAPNLIKIENTTLAAKKSTSINYEANLPMKPTTKLSGTSGSGLYVPTTATTVVTSTTGAKETPTQLPISEAQAFVDNSIAGPALTLYADGGAPVTMSTRWAKIKDADATVTPATPAVWNLFYASDPGAAPNASAWNNAGYGFTFDTAGRLQEPASGVAAIDNVTINGAALGTINFKFDAATLTQYADNSGAVTTNTLFQDGFAAGTLNDIGVTEEGMVVGTYSNGSVVNLASVGIARFHSPTGLKPNSNGTFEQTVESGAPLTGLNGGSIIGASVEQSNTDIAEEFSKMIVTQQAYSANTKVMSTAQQMMSDLLNIVR